MPQTLPNGMTIPINADAYNLTLDLATMGNTANVIIPVANQAARDALTPTAGTSVTRLDLPGAPIQVYDGTAWSGKLRYTPTNVSNLNCSGSIVLDNSGGIQTVAANFQMIFTTSTVISTSFVNLGNAIPSAVRSASAAQIYDGKWVSGAGFNIPIAIFIDPNAGSISMKVQSGSTTFVSGCVFSINAVWSI